MGPRDDDVSIHAPRVGRDSASTRASCAVVRFQSTRPAWGATKGPSQDCARLACFNPRAPRGARHVGPVLSARVVGVSIHAPRVGRDQDKGKGSPGGRVSIHAPRVGRDLAHPTTAFTTIWFQSTRPAWGATGLLTADELFKTFQSTRPAWGATHVDLRDVRGLRVSIHAPRVGRDMRMRVRISDGLWFQSTRPAWGATRCCRSMPRSPSTFQSTRPAWGATAIPTQDQPIHGVSIHAPRVGRDYGPGRVQETGGGFNPRAPRGARPLLRPAPWRRGEVSIHAPRVGRDPPAGCDQAGTNRFNPRAPRGARHCDDAHHRVHYVVSIHAPRVGRDLAAIDRDQRLACFNPRAPRGARPVCRVIL